MSVLVQDTGEFKGWKYWSDDDFESVLVGPFYYKEEEDGSIVSAFRAEQKHMNGAGNMHGGCLMTFADSAIFSIATKELQGSNSVTMTMNSEFLGGAQVGDYMEARGEVLRAGRSVVFIRGVITAEGRPCLNFSATIKKLKPRAA